jgi:hypothetical protein
LLFSVEVNILSRVENDPSWLLPLPRSRVTRALFALLYLNPDKDHSLAKAGKAIGASAGILRHTGIETLRLRHSPRVAPFARNVPSRGTLHGLVVLLTTLWRR